ncbi:cytochrome P450 [Amycolatopsis aidingensis]|uniref:cytochrome P450 n=1 Tax=Amycolatopsis aidingensis TaxID=2842453 RepID=UPI001C0D2A7A|nr:cytochrome P450 [Amycolatopsis aidingensis]
MILVDWINWMRTEHPVHFDPERKACQVFRHSDIMTVYNDYETFSSDDGHARPPDEEIRIITRGNLANHDPPRHQKLRRLVSKAFTPRVISGLRPRITELVDAHLDRMETDEVDLVSTLTNPIPVMVIAELLGIPTEDRKIFQEWGDGLISLSRRIEVTEKVSEAGEGIKSGFSTIIKEMNAYAFDRIAWRRRHPGDDLITRLAEAEVDGQRLDDEEIVGFVLLMLMAGHVTTTLTLGNIMLCLDDNPAVTAAVRADPERASAAVEETLRQRPPFPTSKRRTAKDTVLGGVEIPADTMVVMWLASANLDEAVFADPATFDLDRSPNPHLTFGAGIHFCLGAGLARLESEIVLQRLLARFPEVRIDRSGVRYYGSTSVHGPDYLPARLR